MACCIVILKNKWPVNTSLRYVAGVTGFQVEKTKTLIEFGDKVSYKEVRPQHNSNLMHNTFLNTQLCDKPGLLLAKDLYKESHTVKTVQFSKST